MRKQSKPADGRNEQARASPKETLSRPQRSLFPIVGIGASAGGLEALEQFIGHVPENSGMAFVIVQHLDPTHKGIMPELLQRITGMDVIQVKDRMRIKPNCVYVIPPNKDMSLLHGVLHLFAPREPRGLRLPIDFFFRSLAEDQQTYGIGVILSGMGSDGTLGLRAIKEKAGVALVQEPASAKFDSMPRSAIDAGVADLVAPSEELPEKIISYLRYALTLAKPEHPLEKKDQSSLEKVLILLRDRTGQDFSLYKKNTVYRRIERRMGIHQINRIAAYVRYLQGNSQEVELLFKELLIGVTSFFRDPAAWEQLREEIIPALLSDHSLTDPVGGVLRAWSVGCSTGEEAYSLAMVFKEALEQVMPTGNFTLQIFATDLDRDAIDKARQGVYPANISADISPEHLRRFFIREGNSYRVSKEIREMVTFATQNVIMDPPFTRL
ncbi:MAG: chemotaxis protein CheB, partial [Thermodesulfovibrio sp.]|nr:chemotaxis protein CheB [Thermodesulfovibrio sp.]